MGSLEEVKKRISEIIAQLPELSRLKDQVALEITDEGLRIELLDKENSNFFDLGSANLKPETQEVLKIIARELGKLPNHVGVEGHTDSRPYGTKNYTNWELSADRANAARRLMEDAGVKPGQVVSVRGCADRQLRNPKDPLDFQNRRVSIMVMFQGQTRQEPLDLKKIEEDLHKSPEKAWPRRRLRFQRPRPRGPWHCRRRPRLQRTPPPRNPAGRTSPKPARPRAPAPKQPRLPPRQHPGHTRSRPGGAKPGSAPAPHLAGRGQRRGAADAAATTRRRPRPPRQLHSG